MTTATQRIYNFSAGPCTLPVEALEQARDHFVNYRNTGMSLIEMSHRCDTVDEVHTTAIASVKELLGLPDTHHVLFLGGGATFQFGMIPLNLLHGGKTADYTHSGAWAQKAIDDAKLVGNVNLAFDGTDSNYMTLPTPAPAPGSGPGSLQLTEGAEYLHITSNETIGGLQWKEFPQVDVPLVADMSSDIMSRQLPIERFGLIYAGAQKNIGPAGVALVIISDEMLDKCPGTLINYLNYRDHVEANSMRNTPPVFQIWMIHLVLDWLKGKGGLTWAAEMATKRSQLIYEAINRHAGFYACPVDERYRSTMNVVFRLPDEALEKRFIKEAEANGMDGLKGHRSVGGCRASVYNAMPIEGAATLASFMNDFAMKNG